MRIVKYFEKKLSHEEVYNELKNGSLKLMCGDTQYSIFPGNKIEKIYVNEKGKLVDTIFDFNYPTVYTMFHDTFGKYGEVLPFGPWYYGYFDD